MAYNNDNDRSPVMFPESGQTYYPPQKPRKKHIFWWIVGWLFCFPIPLTILVARSRLGRGLKAAIIAVGWIAWLLIGMHYRSDSSKSDEPVRSAAAVTETAAPRTTPRPAARPTPRPTARPATTPKPTPVPEPEEEAYEEEPEEEPEEVYEEPASSVVTPSFKEAMDSYEAFFDEYCEFMKSMSDDPTDFTFLMQYADMMARYADTMDKLDAIDEDELSPADLAYYIEVTARIETKLIEAANYGG